MLINKLKSYCLNKIVKFEGGEKYSKTIRQYYKKKYNTDVGLYTYGSCFKQQFNIKGTVKIGRYCSFAGDIRYYAGNHPMNHISTSPFFYNKEWAKFDVKDIERKSLEIGNDVWIGTNVVITNKCLKIGNGAVIGAGTIVTKDVPPYSVVVGNPGRVIKYRFDDDTIKLIEKSKWWELTPDELLKYYEFIDKPDVFCSKIIAERRK